LHTCCTPIAHRMPRGNCHNACQMAATVARQLSYEESPNKLASFELADELEMGLSGAGPLGAHGIKVPPTPRGSELERHSVLYQENTNEYHLMDQHLELLLVATCEPPKRPRRIDLRLPGPAGMLSPVAGSVGSVFVGDDAGPNAAARRTRSWTMPSFTLLACDDDVQVWTLQQTVCEQCAHRPWHSTCGYLGKGQQLAKIHHRCQVLAGTKVHSAGVYLPPLCSAGAGTNSAGWCPASAGCDLGGSLSPTNSTTSSLSPSNRRRQGGASSRRQQLPLTPGSDEQEGQPVEEMVEQPLLLQTRLPTWDGEVESLVLNFQGRSNVIPSPRNFILEANRPEEDRVSIVLQHAKSGSKSWCLDFTYPLSPVQAFAVSMSSICWD